MPPSGLLAEILSDDRGAPDPVACGHHVYTAHIRNFTSFIKKSAGALIPLAEGVAGAETAKAADDNQQCGVHKTGTTCKADKQLE
jgi:hypothetical protein